RSSRRLRSAQRLPSAARSDCAAASEPRAALFSRRPGLLYWAARTVTAQLGGPMKRATPAADKSANKKTATRKKTTSWSSAHPTPELLSFKEADQRLGGALSDTFQASYGTVLLFEGDVTLAGDLLTALAKLEQREFDLIAVQGNLTVAGCIALYDSMPGLYV